MKELDATQVEQLRTIGAYLGRERKDRGVSLDEIAVKTYIPQRLLQALEDGQVERLPEPVFVQGFIRRFADAIGLDGMALAKTFTPQASFLVERNVPEAAHPSSERPSLEQSRVDPPAAEPIAVGTVVEPIQIPLETLQRSANATKRSNLPWILLGTVVILLIGVGLLNFLNRPKPAIEAQNAEAPAPKANSVSPSPAPSAATAPIKSPQSSDSPLPTASAKSTATTETDSPVQVAVNLTDDSWFQVIADGKTEYEGILKKGEQKTWTARKKLVLQAGNAGAVSLSYNQGEAKRMGELGEVKDATFLPSDQLKPNTPN
ncbi:MAG: DUF4115 domain-containing protein [Stenomitos rutilans HA7619-LM2]|jgi:cytoskeletal protein RodZ|nr:DUF4115 domain-containing protein [Stenomitos rutilans HA7619-LM2]